MWTFAASLLALFVVAASSGGCTLSRSGELQQQCTSAAECVLPNPCYVASCGDNAQCVFTATDNSAVLEQTAGDCARWACVIDGDSAEPVKLAADDDRPDDVECVTRYSCADRELQQSGVAPGTLCGPQDQGQCANGACVVACDVAGDPRCNDGNVCTNDICNLQRNECEHEAIDNVDAPVQTEGDCRVVLCALGVQTEIYDDLDVFDDGSECTDDSCNQGQPVNAPLPQGDACTGVDPLASVCDGLGACVQCNADVECIDFMTGWTDTDCQTPRCVAGTCELSCEPLGTVAANQSPTPDCHTVVCDGACDYQNDIDDGDVRDDGIACTEDRCDLGVESHPPEPINTSCGAGLLCDGNGNCGVCNVDDDCTADTFCRDYSCNLAATPHQCVFAAQNEGLDLPIGQTDGDCHTLRCNAGDPEDQIDDTDLRVDNLACTDDVCTLGVPTNPPLAVDEPCSEGANGRFCDGNGACVNCNDVTQCTASTGICQQDACTANNCEIEFFADTVNAPMSCQSATPDCQVVKCDGLGDCGASVPDDADVVDDGLECTADSCSGGAEVHDSAILEGVMCTQNSVFCDGAETCQSGVCLTDGPRCPGHDVGPLCNDSCDEIGQSCTANDAPTTSCDDGMFCTDVDTCDGSGSCVGTGNPCPGHDVGPDCADSCQELGGGAGDCAGPDANTTSCDDLLFCTGVETCNGAGMCLATGDPCDGPDGDAQCAETCNEAADDCSLPDPDFSDCGGSSVCVTGVCEDVRIVFVTSTLYDGDDLGSAALADAACAARASAASLPGTFMAWVSDGTTSPAVRFTAAAVPYVLLDTTRVADDFAQLTSGTLDAAIAVDELGLAVSAATVFTGTNDDGTAATDHCTSWTSADSGTDGAAGTTTSAGSGWSNNGTATCDTSLRLYCFEQ